MEIYKEIALLACQLNGTDSPRVNAILASCGVVYPGVTTQKLLHVLTNMHRYNEKSLMAAIQTARKVTT